VTNFLFSTFMKCSLSVHFEHKRLTKIILISSKCKCNFRIKLMHNIELYIMPACCIARIRERRRNPPHDCGAAMRIERANRPSASTRIFLHRDPRMCLLRVSMRKKLFRVSKPHKTPQKVGVVRRFQAKHKKNRIFNIFETISTISTCIRQLKRICTLSNAIHCIGEIKIVKICVT